MGNKKTEQKEASFLSSFQCLSVQSIQHNKVEYAGVLCSESNKVEGATEG